MDLTELKRTISLCKESISTTSQDLTKLTGRSYDRSLDVNRQISNSSASFRDSFTNNTRFTGKRRTSYENENPIESKKSRIDKEAPSLNSVVQMTKGRTRNDALHDLKTKENPKEKERCKRLFGHLMGTLNSIKKEAEKSCNDPQQITRMKIEKKVEEDHKMISETIQREQNELIRTKRDMQSDLRSLNQRYRAAEAFERWRVEKEKMKGFIRTSKLPFIFYKPKTINEETQLRIDQTAREIDSLIEARKKKLETEIDRVVKRHLEASCNKHLDGIEIVNNIKREESLHESTASLVLNNAAGKERSKSVANSFASEDYDDMIEEIEITMHDEPVAVHEGEERITNEGGDLTVVDSERQSMGEEEEEVRKVIDEGNSVLEENDMEVKKEGNIADNGCGIVVPGEPEVMELDHGEEEPNMVAAQPMIIEAAPVVIEEVISQVPESS